MYNLLKISDVHYIYIDMINVYFKIVREHVYLCFYLRRRRVELSCGIFCSDKLWEHGYVSRKHPEYPEISKKLDHFLTVARASIKISSTKLGTTLDLDKVKEVYLSLIQKNHLEEFDKLNVRVGFTMIEDFKKFMELQKRVIKANTLKKYKTALNILVEFEHHLGTQLDVDTFDKASFEQLVAFMIFHKNHRNNTIATQAGVMKAFYAKMYPKADRSFITYKEYRPEVVALTEDELMHFIGIPFHGIQERVKDLFVFMCTTGMRISDTHRFSPYWVQNELITYSANKTMSKAYVPLLEITEVILEKYGNQAPVMNEQYFNRLIKKMFRDVGMNRPIVRRHRQGRYEHEEILPLCDAVSSHTGRKTFISMMLDRGVPIQDVMNMSGHQDYRSMKPYIRINQDHMRQYRDKLGF
jgi:site-specific recombinase XerD